MNDNVENNIEETTVSDTKQETPSIETTQLNNREATEETSVQQQIGIEGEILPDETTSVDESVDTSQDVVSSDETTETTSLIEADPQPANMSIPFIGLSAIQCVVAFFLIVVVLQQSKSASSITSGAIVGSGDNQSYWSKNKGRSKESKLARTTVILGLIFFIITIALGFIR